MSNFHVCVGENEPTSYKRRAFATAAVLGKRQGIKIHTTRNKDDERVWIFLSLEDFMAVHRYYEELTKIPMGKWDDYCNQFKEEPV